MNKSIENKLLRKVNFFRFMQVLLISLLLFQTVISVDAKPLGKVVVVTDNSTIYETVNTSIYREYKLVENNGKVTVVSFNEETGLLTIGNQVVNVNLSKSEKPLIQSQYSILSGPTINYDSAANGSFSFYSASVELTVIAIQATVTGFSYSTMYDALIAVGNNSLIEVSYTQYRSNESYYSSYYNSYYNKAINKNLKVKDDGVQKYYSSAGFWFDPIRVA